MATRGATISELPSEIIEEIFRYLTVEDSARVRRVCQQWDAIMESDMLWKQWFETSGLRLSYGTRGISDQVSFKERLRLSMEQEKRRREVELAALRAMEDSPFVYSPQRRSCCSFQDLYEMLMKPRFVALFFSLGALLLVVSICQAVNGSWTSMPAAALLLSFSALCTATLVFIGCKETVGYRERYLCILLASAMFTVFALLWVLQQAGVYALLSVYVAIPVALGWLMGFVLYVCLCCVPR